MNKTPRANRIHIGIYGMRNAGKSTLLNYITDQETSLVSDHKGTTTDPVYKAMEIPGIGPVVFIDTAGLDDQGELGELRIKKSQEVLDKCDLAIYIFSSQGDLSKDLKEYKYISQRKFPVISAISDKGNLDKRLEELAEKNIKPLLINIDSLESRDLLISKLQEKTEEIRRKEATITRNLVGEKDLVLLVMPQDIQAPKGRLILPQVQTIRDILDKQAMCMCTSTENLPEALKSLSRDPDLIITDSQVFDQVYKLKPKASRLSSFSVLFAALKGDIDYFIDSTKAFEKLGENSRILIAEACTHPPLEEDIGRVKIPRMLREKYSLGEIDFVRGDDMPEDLTPYDLVIHCGACMFNRAHVQSRVARAKDQGVPMTNYGVTIAYLRGILDKIVY